MILVGGEVGGQPGRVRTMEAMDYLRKKAEKIAEKSLAGVSDAIYATGSAVGKGGSKVTSFFASSAGAVGSGIYEQCCDLVAAAGNMTKVHEVLAMDLNQ